MFVRASTRVPDPRLGFWLDQQVDRLGRLLPQRRSAVAPARMSVVARYLNRMFLVRFFVVLFGVIGFATVIDLIDVGAELVRRPRGRLPPACAISAFGCRSCFPS